MTPSELAECAQLTMANGLPAAEIDNAFSAAVIANPNDRLLLAQWNDSLRSRFSDVEIGNLLGGLQAEASQPIRSVLLALRDDFGSEHVADYCANFQALSESEDLKLIKDAWMQISRGSIETADGAVARLLTVPHEIFELYFAVFAPMIPTFVMSNNKDLLALESKGYKIEVMKSTAQRFSWIGSDLSDIITSHGLDTWRTEKIISVERRGYYKYEILKTGNFMLEDPWTGEAIAARDSFRIFGRTIYTFLGSKLFFVICGRQGNDALGLFVPSENIAIAFDSTTRGQLNTKLLSNVNAVLLKRAFRMHEAFNSALSSASKVEAKAVIVHIEKTENFAHHLWNFYSSLDHMIEMGLQANISRVVFSGTRFFGELGDFFPEVRSVIDRPIRNNIVDPCPFSQSEILVGAGSNFMARSLPERLIAAAKISYSDAASDIASITENAYPVIWIGIRLKDKSWVSQAKGIPLIIDAISEQYPNALFLLDAFSLPMMDQANISQWESYKSQVSAISNTIVANVRAPERVVDLVGNTMGESVLWASKVDAYFSPLGTSQHKVGWFSDAPGVVYTSPVFDGKALTTPGAWAAGISPTPEFVTGQPASAGERRGVSRSREAFENVELDVADIIERLLLLLAKNQVEKAT